MRTARMMLALVALGFAGSAAAQATPATATFRDWLAACGNDGACVAFGKPREFGPAWVRVEMGAGPQAEPRIQFGYPDWSDGEQTPRFSVAIDGVDLRTTTNIDGLPALTGHGAREALARMARGSSLTFDGGADPTEVSLSGASAALLWIDERQGRLDTPSALIRRGARSDRSVPAAPPLPRLRAAPPVSQSGLEGRPLPPMLAATATVRECLADEELAGTPPTAHRLGADLLLWTIPCFRGAYNFGSVLWTTRDDGSDPRPLALTNARGEAVTEIVNGGYDPATRQIDAFAKGRGIGDCGVAQRWLWTGQGFELLDESGMDDCFGVRSDYWPVLWRAEQLD